LVVSRDTSAIPVFFKAPMFSSPRIPSEMLLLFIISSVPGHFEIWPPYYVIFYFTIIFCTFYPLCLLLASLARYTKIAGPGKPIVDKKTFSNSPLKKGD
jgi:hypothetical protein